MGELIPRNLLLKMVKLCNESFLEPLTRTIINEIQTEKIYTVPSTMLHLYTYLPNFKQAIATISKSRDWSLMDDFLTTLAVKQDQVNTNECC